MVDIEKAKSEYADLLSKISGRKGVVGLAEYLEKHGLFKAPASTRFHLCVEGGLLEHSISVTKLALKMKTVMYPNAPDESVILCGLFHDAHKVTDGFGNPTYLKNDYKGAEKWPYLWNKEQMSFTGAQKSLLIIGKFVDLTMDEMQAIAYHDGPYSESWEDIKGEPYPLTLLMHSADMWSAWVLEKGKEKPRADKKFMEDK